MNDKVPATQDRCYIIHNLRSQSGDRAAAELKERMITIRARASDWHHLSALMAAVQILHQNSEVSRDARNWKELLEKIVIKELAIKETPV